MRIYVMRHGIAVEPGDPTAPATDEERALTHDGIERARLAFHGMVAMGVVVDRIVASPLLRCTQTAELAAEILGVPRFSVETHPGLRPDGDFGEMLVSLRRLPDDGVLLVGHSPSVDLIVARLLGVPAPVTALKKAGMAVLTGKSGQENCRLVAMLEPKLLRRLGRSE